MITSMQNKTVKELLKFKTKEISKRLLFSRNKSFSRGSN